ncbi:chemotaxis protein CheB [Pseudoroseomonas deserti]|uniref:protein-glutamate methylesterase n=1 Tax=Teichococcus deserti TaxID=1817963 RepID=A0A1V2H4Y7_9PROT|nr:chemotaxis protein CheB [Pseudoroseomonas deserti]ONG56115.1 chemotaxis protein CheB [Pseudoroseomonas deserti]
MATPAIKDIVVIGGSAGSTSVLQQLLADLPGDLPASLLIATHLPAQSPGYLARMLDQNARLKVVQAVDTQLPEPGHVYVAPPDRHLLLVDGVLRLGTGPRENMVRPAIDALFRSAAASAGSRVIGVVLSGMLNDGAAGLASIKACGGTAVVQHPLDAAEEQMPLAALEAAEVDHVAPAAQLGALLAGLIGSAAGASPAPSAALRLEVDIALGQRLGSDRLRQIATPSALSCPACQGVLSEVEGSRPLRFRCQIGHAYTAEALLADIDAVDEALRVAMRVMEERVTLVERMADEARQSGRKAVAELYAARAEEYRHYASTLRRAAASALHLGQGRRGEAS